MKPIMKLMILNWLHVPFRCQLMIDNKSNSTKEISDIKSRRNSNVDSFQSVTENIAVMDYTELEPIHQNQQNENSN